MPVLRLFAAARQAAGISTDEVPGVTVEEVLAAARARYGPDFGPVLDASRVWCNGEPVALDAPVGPGDEVAVLPPVSGGAEETPPTPPGAPRPPRPAPAPGARPPGAPRPVRPAPAPGVSGRPRPPAKAPAPQPGRHGSRPAAGAPGPTPRAAPSPRPSPSARRSPSAGQVPPGGSTGTLTRTPTITGAPLAPTEDGDGARPARRVTRIRSVPVPVTGQVKVGGKERRVSGARVRTTALGRRYAVVYDTSGPKVTLGLLWFVAVLAAMSQGWAPVTLLYGVAAGWAALETARRQAEVGAGADWRVAGVGAAVVAASAAAGARAMGATTLALIVVAVVAATVAHDRTDVMAAAGSTVLSTLPFAFASASVVLTRDLEIGAAVVLVLFVSAYEVGDFLIGSGASNSIEGPLIGIVTLAVTAIVVAVLQVPPFDGPSVFTFAALAALACPAGQLAVSALLPAPDAHAPAARRLDSLVLLAPLWVWTTGLYVAQLT